MSTPKLSVLVVTHNRPRRLQRVLEDLRAQSLAKADFEVIISDDGSQPPVQGTLPQGDTLDLRIVAGPSRGPATARNRALPLVRAPFLVLLNDDVWLAPDLLQTHLRLQQQSTRPTAHMGAFVFPESIRQDLFHYIAEEAGLIGTLHIAAKIPLPVSMFWTGNMSLPIEDVRAVGGFDEAFDEAKGDDLDLGYRLLHERDVRLIYSPEAKAWHDHPHSLPAWWERARMTGRALRKLAEKTRDPFFWPGDNTMNSPAAARSTKHRLLAQEPLYTELFTWIERGITGQAPHGTHYIHILERHYQLPQELPQLLHAALAAATLYLVHQAFWLSSP